MAQILAGNQSATATAAASGVLLGGAASTSSNNSASSSSIKANRFQYAGDGADASDGKADWKAQKAAAAMQKKKEKELKACEEEIAKLEERNEVLNEEMSRPEIATDLAELRKRTDEQEDITAKLEVLYDKWAMLSE
jgi:ATP-binding cassette subfamily F protein 3